MIGIRTTRALRTTSMLKGARENNNNNNNASADSSDEDAEADNKNIKP